MQQLIDARRGLGVLGFLGQTAPLIGFVSTFMGILNAFNAAIDSNKVMAAQAIGGLAEAVVPTVAGLAVAILANICIDLVSALFDRFQARARGGRRRTRGCAALHPGPEGAHGLILGRRRREPPTRDRFGKKARPRPLPPFSLGRGAAGGRPGAGSG